MMQTINLDDLILASGSHGTEFCAEAWQLEGYPTNARIAAGQRLDAARLLATPAPQTPSEGGTDG